jgi:hypothetical protein
MMLKKSALLAAGLAVASLGLLPGCNNNKQGDDAAPVYLTISFELLPAQKNVADGLPLQIQMAAVRNVIKVPGNGLSSFLDVQLDRYRVDWERIDGGTRTSASEEFGGDVVVPAGGSSNLTNYIFMSRSAMMLPPLDQLFPFNGGIDRETGKQEVRMRAHVTLFGHTLAGQPVGGTGNFDMDFIYIPLTGRAQGRPVP